MKMPLLDFIKRKNAVVSIEVALSFPVLLFIIMMFFELARIALIVSITSFSLEKAMQNFRSDIGFYSIGEERIKESVTENIVLYSFDFLGDENIEVELQAFSNLNEFAGEQEEDKDSKKIPILNFTIFLKERFMTPLPSMFGLGDSFQHEYRYILGDLIGVADS